jgi:outer membrane protein assembly factor BamB
MITLMRKHLLPLLAVGLVAIAGRADDASLKPIDNWHQWRGPLANGSSPGGDPPIKWDEKTNIRWKTAIPGKGSSTPIIWGDRIFLQTAIDTGKQAAPADLPKADPGFERKTSAPTTYHQFVLLCLDRRDGKVRWQQVAAEVVPHEGHHPTHSYAAFSPTTDGRFVYLSFGSRGVYCYDFDGKLQWKRHFGRMNTRYGWGEGASPVVHGDTLLVPWDQEKNSFVVALDVRTGKTLWKHDRDEPTAWTTPLIVEYQGKTQAIVSGTNRVRSYDLATGQVLWQCGGQTINVIPSPIRFGDAVICMSGYRGAFACSVALDAKGDVTNTSKVQWRTARLGTPYVPSPLLAGDRLYFTQMNQAVLSIVDPKTGQALLDRQRLPGLGTLYASPMHAAGRIYIPDREGMTLVLKKSDRIEVLAVNHLKEPIDASPAVVGKQLFLRGEKHLYCIEEKP